MPDFQVVSKFQPAGDQPKAIAQLTDGIERGLKHQVLLGITGSGKTFCIANVIAATKRPTLVISHNKTLAAQLYEELHEFFPHNGVEYFVSYFDTYQPESYIPQTDTYIEKESSVNDEIDRLRHAATQSLVERRDVIVVASVSCIYGWGSPEMYRETTLTLEKGKSYRRRELLDKLVDMQFSRNDFNVTRGSFRFRGDVLEIQPKESEFVTRVDFFDEDVDKILVVNPLTGELIADQDKIVIFPATPYLASETRTKQAIENILKELDEQVAHFLREGKIVEAQRLKQRTMYDVEMIREVGYCTGIENYSRHLDGRQPGEAPFTLIDYFPKDFLVIIDESHQTIPQLRAMWAGEKSRKDNLIGYGFRLPSAYDNRPLHFEEFAQRVHQVIYMSATPGPYELGNSQQTVELIVRPTGLLDPAVEVRPTRNQVDDLIEEIRQRVEKGQRVLVTTLTKQTAEDLTRYLADLDIKVNYLHSDVYTLERPVILRDLRLGKYDVVVGINLLREGLDLPEVSLVAILDADKEGFLRSETSLIQTIGRAARHVEGKVILYAENITGSMRRAMDETNRRRKIQMEFNAQHGITPMTVKKDVRDLTKMRLVAEDRAAYQADTKPSDETPFEDIPRRIAELEKEMKAAALRLDFEHAAECRDEIVRLKKRLAA
jgi:excinuclease ABC subunit B